MVQGVQQAPQAPSYAPAGIQVPANIATPEATMNSVKDQQSQLNAVNNLTSGEVADISSSGIVVRPSEKDERRSFAHTRAVGIRAAALHKREEKLFRFLKWDQYAMVALNALLHKTRHLHPCRIKENPTALMMGI